MIEETTRRTFAKPGPVISAATIRLHTRVAVDLFHGHRGFTWFAANLNKLWDFSLQDDPYADYQLILVEEQLPLVRQYLSQKTEDIEMRLGALADAGIEAISHQSVRPIEIPITFRATQAAAAVLHLAALDQLTQKALMARHFGLLTETGWESCVRQSARALRDLFTLSEYQAGGACRDDFSSNNAKAHVAIERFGDLPTEVLEGVKRPALGPRHP